MKSIFLSAQKSPAQGRTPIYLIWTPKNMVKTHTVTVFDSVWSIKLQYHTTKTILHEQGDDYLIN